MAGSIPVRLRQPDDPPDASKGVNVTDARRLVPRTDRVLADPRLVQAAVRLGPGPVKRAVVAAQQLARAAEITPAEVADAAVAALPPVSSTRTVLNATGVVLHTNLGRAPLSAAAVKALTRAAGVTDVEFDLATGLRAARGRVTLAALAEAVPAAGAVAVVNNGAAALVLATTALAAGREVVVSRGELVEIGDGFRLPDLIAATGARLREVGTTNRTHLADYAAAIGPDTGCVLKVHPSNFWLGGFTSAVPVAELATLGPPVVADIGSGLLAPDPLLPAEHDADTALRAGAAVVTASADKLLGGPQAGLLLGDAEVISRLRRHPLARALRVDKLTLAALEATLRGGPTPTGAALHADPDVLHARTEALIRQLIGDVSGEPVDVAVVPADGAVGGGGAPGVVLPGWALSLPAAYAVPLRLGDPAVVGRVEHGRCLLDLRCVSPSADAVLAAAVLAVRVVEP
ncbi:MAG: L-seryl-tRNA(Sec) selenium transferase [Propionibacteriaceae bacterium]